MENKRNMQRYIMDALNFIRFEAIGGLMLLGAAIVALVLVNAGFGPVYNQLLNEPIGFRVGPFGLEKTLLHWINDGLMAIFFFLVGLEIKREIKVGELSSVRRAALPFFAAIGGIVCPALIYAAINFDNAETLRGWAIPAATDIAFAVACLAVLGSRIPPALKIFLLAVAILDDIGAILIIALFYTANLSLTALIFAAVGVAVLAIMNFAGVRRVLPYILVGIFVWACVLKSGIHATLAGVITALAIPLYSSSGDLHEGPLESLEIALHPWVTYLVLPLFAFANAGVSLAGVTPQTLLGMIPLGIIAGLVIGKPIGLFVMSWVAVNLGLCEKPEGTNWQQILGVGFLAGIGFTMSLFIGMLAFPDPAYAAEVRIGVISGSIISALLGLLVLSTAGRSEPIPTPGPAPQT